MDEATGHLGGCARQSRFRCAKEERTCHPTRITAGALHTWSLCTTCSIVTGRTEALLEGLKKATGSPTKAPSEVEYTAAHNNIREAGTPRRSSPDRLRNIKSGFTLPCEGSGLRGALNLDSVEGPCRDI